jgi:hypothetical protein
MQPPPRARVGDLRVSSHRARRRAGNADRRIGRVFGETLPAVGAREIERSAPGYGFDANLDHLKLGDSMIDVDSWLDAPEGVALQWTGRPVSDPSPASCCQMV